MSKTAVSLINVSKKYVIHHEKPTLAENIFASRKKEEFFALKNINLAINMGERLGIVGPNGSGKTTLLEIIGSITTPSSGKVVTNGKTVSLIELGAGFHPDLTGEENIYVNGLLLGMSKDEIRSKFDQIISFADIGQFIDTPMYTYSGGMKLKLGFAIVAHANFDTLLLDEHLAVGDQEFREKSFDKIQEFVKQGKTIVIASHLLGYIKNYTTRTILLDKGRIIKDGPSKKVVSEYNKSKEVVS
jgi:ABC-type polysaccharide/polyol phosphate transport system ATPase subunit